MRKVALQAMRKVALQAMRKVALQAMRKVALQAMRKALSILVTKYKEGAPTRPQNVSAMVCKK
jgi:hypothetical protein